MSKLPSAAELARLCREGQHYQQIADQYGVSAHKIQYHLMRHGLWEPYLAYNAIFWQQANQILPLIRAGCRSQTALARKTGIRKPRLFILVKNLTALGYITKQPGKCGALTLTPQAEQQISHITLVYRRTDGALAPLDPSISLIPDTEEETL